MNNTSQRNQENKKQKPQSSWSYFKTSIKNKFGELRNEVSNMMFPTLGMLFWSLIKILLVGTFFCVMILYFDIVVLFILKNVFGYTSIQ